MRMFLAAKSRWIIPRSETWVYKKKTEGKMMVDDKKRTEKDQREPFAILFKIY